jgi:hypothetical protein
MCLVKEALTTACYFLPPATHGVLLFREHPPWRRFAVRFRYRFVHEIKLKLLLVTKHIIRCRDVAPRIIFIVPVRGATPGFQKRHIF